MIEVELPDGRILEFPEGTSQDEMRTAINSLLGVPAEEAPAERGFMAALKDNVIGVDDGVESPGEKLAQFLNIGGESMTFGLVGDEVDAAVRTGGGLLGDYDAALEDYRAREQAFRDNNPGLALTADLGGAMVVPAGAAARAPSLLGRALYGSATAAAGGGVHGLLEGEGGIGLRIDRATDQATTGAVLGAALPIAGAGLSRAANNVIQRRAMRQAAASAPAREAIERQASEMFDQVSGANLPRQGLLDVASDVAETGRQYGMDAMLTPNAARVSNNLEDLATSAGDDLSMQDLQVLRRQAAVPAGNVANRTESAIGTQMINSLDDYVDAVAPELGETGKEARRLWGVLRRSDQIDEAFERASTAASGFENGLQIEFRRILRSPKLLRGFNETEVAAMRSVVNGGPLHGLLRQIGRLGFSLDGGSNAVGGVFGASLGGLLGGPVGAAAVAGIGATARKSSEILRTNAANRARDIIRNPNATQLPAISSQTQGLLDEILNRSARAGAIAY